MILFDTVYNNNNKSSIIPHVGLGEGGAYAILPIPFDTMSVIKKINKHDCSI